MACSSYPHTEWEVSNFQCVGKCFAHWCNGYVMHNWNSNRRNMEEGETRGASRSKRKYRKATPKRSIMQQRRCYDSKAIAEITFLRRFASSQSPVGLFELEFCSTGASISFYSSLAGFAALCKLRYGPPSTVKSKEGHGPSLLVAVETGTRSARKLWCSCFRLRGRKHGYGEHTAWEKPADESNDLCEKVNKYQEMEKRNGKRKSYILVWKYIPIQRGKWESREVS